MRLLDHFGRITLTVGIALALGVTCVTSAQAATGTLTYVSVTGDDFTLSDPENGECYLLLHGATWVDNGTDTHAQLYSDRGCEEPMASLPPGTAGGFDPTVPHSVRFG